MNELKILVKHHLGRLVLFCRSIRINAIKDEIINTEMAILNSKPKP